MSKLALVKISASTAGQNTLLNYGHCNYLEDPTISSYFFTKELLAYYLAIKHAEDKRNYYSTLIPELVNFLGLIEQHGTKILSSTVFNRITKIAANKSPSKLPIESIDPEGYEMLGLSDSLNFDDLKSAYRKAAMKHHPDKGGATKAMQIVNRAYSVYHKYLCRELLVDRIDRATIDKGTSESVNDYLYLVNATLLQIYCDDWDLEHAIGIVRMFLQTDFQGVTVTTASVDHHALVETALALTKKLTSAKRMSDIGTALEFTHAIYNIGGFHLNSSYEESLNRVNAIIAGEMSYGFKINHIRQAENALSLGVISHKTFEELKEKLNAGDIEEELISKNLEGILTDSEPSAEAEIL